MSGPFVIEALSSEHDRKAFACGSEPLDRYIRQQVSQDIRLRVAQCYVARESDSLRVAGFYTLSAGDVALQDVPEDIARKLPRYPVVPVARIGRLAIDTAFQGKRLGGALLWDAVSRAMRAEVGIYAIAVDAKDEQAASFYRHHGFLAFASALDKLFLPLSAVAQAGK